MNIYFDPSHYSRGNRGYLAEILRPLINTRTLAENLHIYGRQVTQYEPVSDPKDADLHLLTMTWGYYFETGQLGKARSFIQQAQTIGKPVAVWQGGDLSIQPPQPGIWLFQCGGRRSIRRVHQFAQSVLIGDPLLELNTPEIALRARSPKPVIGFCGQADYTLSHAFHTRLRFGMHNLQSAFGFIPYEPLPLRPLPTRLRWQVLHQLEQIPDIQTNFIKRKKYRAGAHTSDEQKTSRREFWQNMLASDYIVCVRGTGNFSARLYETLAMGRIPIFIDTDCILPYDQCINWKDYCVWVNSKELASLPEKILEFHARLNEADFLEQQRRCRALWEERLSFSGFFKHFPEHFS